MLNISSPMACSTATCTRKTGETVFNHGLCAWLCLYIQNVHDTYLHSYTNIAWIFCHGTYYIILYTVYTCLHMFAPENNVDTPHVLLKTLPSDFPFYQADWKNSMPGKKGKGRVYTELISPTCGRNLVFNVSKEPGSFTSKSLMSQSLATMKNTRSTEHICSPSNRSTCFALGIISCPRQPPVIWTGSKAKCVFQRRDNMVLSKNRGQSLEFELKEEHDTYRHTIFSGEYRKNDW